MSGSESNIVRFPGRAKYQDAHIPAGEYEAVLLDYETWARCRGWDPRVVLWWQVTTMGPAFETVLPGYYRVKSLSGKARRRGRFRIGTRARLYRDMARMMPHRPPVDHVPLDDFLSTVYVVEVRDVVRDMDGHELPSTIRYSVVNHVVETL